MCSSAWGHPWLQLRLTADQLFGLRVGTNGLARIGSMPSARDWIFGGCSEDRESISAMISRFRRCTCSSDTSAFFKNAMYDEAIRASELIRAAIIPILVDALRCSEVVPVFWTGC